MKTFIFLVLFLTACTIPVQAQSSVDPIPSTYTITAGDNKMGGTGSELILEFTNLAESFYLESVALDNFILGKKMEISEGELLIQLEPPAKHGTSTSRSISWERKKGGLAVNSYDESTIIYYDDGDVTIWIVFTEGGPIIAEKTKTLREKRTRYAKGKAFFTHPFLDGFCRSSPGTIQCRPHSVHVHDYSW